MNLTSFGMLVAIAAAYKCVADAWLGQPVSRVRFPGPRLDDAHFAQLLGQVSLGDVVQSVLRERLLFGLLAVLEHQLDLAAPLCGRKPRVAEFGLERLDVDVAQLVRREL